MEIAYLKVAKIFVATNSTLVVWVTSCAFPLLEWEEEKTDRGSLLSPVLPVTASLVLEGAVLLESGCVSDRIL